MNNGKDQQPPRLALRLLRWYCRPDRLEEIEGDLEKFFWRRSDRKPGRCAKLIFWIDVFHSFRPYACVRTYFTYSLNTKTLCFATISKLP